MFDEVGEVGDEDTPALHRYFEVTRNMGGRIRIQYGHIHQVAEAHWYV